MDSLFDLVPFLFIFIIGLVKFLKKAAESLELEDDYQVNQESEVSRQQSTKELDQIRKETAKQTKSKQETKRKQRSKSQKQSQKTKRTHPLANLGKEELVQGIIMKEIVDKPRAKRPPKQYRDD
ncbi:hypothetical protein [Halanaerobaculum tunisiense]